MEDEKMVPLLIGKSKNPRAFKNIDVESLGIIYKPNKKGWMTKSIFEEYLKIINEGLILKNKKILVVLDNFSGHKIKIFRI